MPGGGLSTLPLFSDQHPHPLPHPHLTAAVGCRGSSSGSQAYVLTFISFIEVSGCIWALTHVVNSKYSKYFLFSGETCRVFKSSWWVQPGDEAIISDAATECIVGRSSNVVLTENCPGRVINQNLRLKVLNGPTRHKLGSNQQVGLSNINVNIVTHSSFLLTFSQQFVLWRTPSHHLWDPNEEASPREHLHTGLRQTERM